jgi:hypothetical protein
LSVGPLVVTVAVLLLYVLPALVATGRLKRVGQKLGYRISSEQDMQEAKRSFT